MYWQGLCDLKLLQSVVLFPALRRCWSHIPSLGLWGFLASLVPRRRCHVWPYLCYPLPLAMLPDGVGLIVFLPQSQWRQFNASGRLSQSLAAPGLSSIILRIMWQQGWGWERWKSCSIRVCSWVRVWPPLCTAVCRTHTLAVNNQTGFVSWL